MTIFSELHEAGIAKSFEYNDDRFIIRGFWKIDQLFKPKPQDLDLNLKYLVCQTSGPGCCYYPIEESVEIPPDILGKDARYIKSDNYFIRIAILDSIYSGFTNNASKRHTLVGSPELKANHRASIVAHEIKRITPKTKSNHARVLVVGVVTNFIESFIKDGYEVLATDFRSQIVGQAIHGTKVVHGTNTLEMLKTCEIAVVTGMTLSTKTIDQVISNAKMNNTKLLFYCETGASLCPEYRSYGVDVVVSERFPFYVFDGESIINIFR